MENREYYEKKLEVISTIKGKWCKTGTFKNYFNRFAADYGNIVMMVTIETIDTIKTIETIVETQDIASLRPSTTFYDVSSFIKNTKNSSLFFSPALKN